MAQAHPIKALAIIAEKLLQSGNSSIGFLNAQQCKETYLNDPEFQQSLVCEQPLRPEYLLLQRSGFDVKANFDANEKPFDACLILWGKFRELNEAMVMRARQLTAKNGLIIISGAKNDGIASARKRIANSQEIEESYSKFHSLVFWFGNSKPLPDDEIGSIRKTIQSNTISFETSAGLFSAEKIDHGSAMLAEYFDDSIGGDVADLGAGWGYLSRILFEKSSKIASLDLFEADWHGVNACRKNLDKVSANVPITFNWLDVAIEPIIKKYDYVIMNPPFHHGTKTSLDLGLQFIRKAAAILKPGGQMLMVANRHLAYEETLKASFTKSKILREAQGFKVILARK